MYQLFFVKSTSFEKFMTLQLMQFPLNITFLFLQLVGGPCGQHGPYTFYKAFKYSKNGIKKIITLSEFFFVKMWRDSDLLCIGELQLLWTDKNSEQTLASLRLYFLPENTPEGRMDQGEVSRKGLNCTLSLLSGPL